MIDCIYLGIREVDEKHRGVMSDLMVRLIFGDLVEGSLNCSWKGLPSVILSSSAQLAPAFSPRARRKQPG